MKGTSTDQDPRFSNKDKKLLKTMKFDSSLDDPIDMDKVMLDTLKTWIAARVSEILGFEDEVVIDYIYEILESERPLNPHKIQIQITGFLDAKNARIFMRELWHLLKSAENNGGIPKEFVELRMAELEEEKKNKEKLAELISDAVPDTNPISPANKSIKEARINKQNISDNNCSRGSSSHRDSRDRSSERRRSNYRTREKYFTSSESPLDDKKSFHKYSSHKSYHKHDRYSHRSDRYGPSRGNEDKWIRDRSRDVDKYSRRRNRYSSPEDDRKYHKERRADKSSYVSRSTNNRDETDGHRNSSRYHRSRNSPHRNSSRRRSSPYSPPSKQIDRTDSSLKISRRREPISSTSSSDTRNSSINKSFSDSTESFSDTHNSKYSLKHKSTTKDYRTENGHSSLRDHSKSFSLRRRYPEGSLERRRNRSSEGSNNKYSQNRRKRSRKPSSEISNDEIGERKRILDPSSKQPF